MGAFSMSKFNRPTTRPAVHGPIVTASTPAGTTHEGALGYARDAKSELFLLAVSNMAGEPTFYESADARDARLVALTRTVAVADPAWILGFAGWLRGEGNMRSTSLVIAAEAVKARLDADADSNTRAQVVFTARPGDSRMARTVQPTNRAIIASVLQRADEPGEMLAYWTSKYGRKLPMPVKRGVADAAVRLYTEHSLLKYDTASKAFRFGDVLDLTHPDPATPAQDALFRHALDRRHGNDNLQLIAEHLPMVYANVILRSTPVERLLDTDRLKAAGMTWEDVLPLAGGKVSKAALWEALIPTMGYMATLRNLRNFDEAGVSDAVAFQVAARLADPEQVAKSRQFPFRFLAAYRNAPSLRWGHALDVALTASLASVPELPGRTLVLVDRSGSMFGTVSKQSELTWADSAAVFGSALALRNVGRVDLVQYGTGSLPVPVRAGASLLKTIDQFRELGGTETLAAVRAHYRGHDRVVLVTDEQAWAGYGDPGSAVPANIPLYTWNLAGYRYGHGPGAANRHTFGGLTDASFKVISLLENHRDGRWPWQS
jgi:hypothetical protein